ncbi:MAG: DUF4430 domain-containing protein [Candidatus Buchananbacteria bacterium]|nr:DUF4430 domain-containing protein [Candidatus Buchananbacteria bacterium]
MIKKNALPIFRIIVVFSLLLQPVFVSASLSGAVSYLESQVDDPWITMALVASGQTNIPTGHLKQVSGTSATDYAKTILALAALGKDPSTFGNVDYVAALEDTFDGTQIGDVNLLNDDMWGILALASVGKKTSAAVTATKTYLLSKQNSDGGWSYSAGAGSDTNDTAAAVIALIEAGVGANNEVITKALAYIKSAQNSDGGVGYQPGNGSDAGSDAWTISALIKAGVNPSGWTKNNISPIQHLESLQDEDGGYWWVTEGTSEWNNKAMTAYAVIALSGATYPVGYYQSGAANDGEFHLRIEGASNTICDTFVAGVTALDLVKNAAAECGYSYTITQESFGPYLREIAGETASGLNGWLYFVNSASPIVGAADYHLASGDEVLWYFGEWGVMPTRLNVSETQVDPGQAIDVVAEYFDGSSWRPVSGATIKVNDEVRQAGTNGTLALQIYENGIYRIYADHAGYVRSNTVTVTVGDTVNQNVGLQVEINQGTAGVIGGEAIALVVDASDIDFGPLAPGHGSEAEVVISNQGTVNLGVGTQVSGDVVFTKGLKINDAAHAEYADTLVAGQSKSTKVVLNVPSDYLASGVKTGELTFWATVQP